MAVLREQGVNSQVEMAAVLELAGFEAHDIHMSDLLSGLHDLTQFRGLIACGGFSYGDVLGAGEGWAKSILFHERTRAEFTRYFERGDTFTLGVCNGCQMMAALKQLVPGTEHWPRFVRNRGEQFEGRFSWWRFSTHLPCCWRAWLVRGCPSRWRMEKARRSSRTTRSRRVSRATASSRFAMWTTAAPSPRRIPPIPMVPRRASPR